MEHNDTNICRLCNGGFRPTWLLDDTCPPCAQWERSTGNVRDTEHVIEALQRAMSANPGARVAQILVDAIERACVDDGDDEPDIYEFAGMSDGYLANALVRFAAKTGD